MKDYAELKNHATVESVRFVGGGIAVVTLKSNYGNANFDHYHSANQTVHAPFFRTAKDFVEGAKPSRYADTPGGNPCRVADGTPRSCNPHTELYWSM